MLLLSALLLYWFFSKGHSAKQSKGRCQGKIKSFHSRCAGAGHFSLLVQRKGNQKKARPASAPNALRASGPLRRRDFSTRHPCRVENRRAPMHVAPCGVLSVGSVAAEGNPKVKSWKQQQQQNTSASPREKRSWSRTRFAARLSAKRFQSSRLHLTKQPASRTRLSVRRLRTRKTTTV